MSKMLGEHLLIVLLFKSTISLLLEARITSFFSPATLRVVIGSLTLTSQSHYVLEWLELFLIIGSIDSTFSLQSAPNVYMAIAR